MQHKAAEARIKKLDASDKLAEAAKVNRVLELTREALTTLHSSTIMHEYAGAESSSLGGILIHLEQLYRNLTSQE